jgi:hypothetical protein
MMKRHLGILVWACLAACGLHAQAVDTTVCDVLKNPESFNGKTVRIKGAVRAGYDQFVISDGDCGQSVNGIWLDYPQGSKAKSGPLAVVTLQPAHNFAGKVAPAGAAAVTLTRDKAFKQFDSALSREYHPAVGLCMGCFKNQVKATLTGRLDSVGDASIQRSKGKIVGLGGFGNVNAYPARLVIESVADVSSVPVDYSKVDAAMKKAGSGPPAGTMFSDAKGTAQKIVAAMAPSQITTQMQDDIAVLGKPGEQNGVVIGFGGANELHADEESASAQDSPDGVQYNLRFNKDKLQDLAMSSALLHAAQHVEDIRTPQADNVLAPLVILENNAWAVSGTLAVADGQKFYILPGGYVMWDSSWPAADRTNNMESALNDFLSKEEMLNK